MVSVALCTYNGARFIREQLESIICQTVPIEEIVVCDDGSTDNTLEIIKSIAGSSDKKFLLSQNEKRLGFKENFFNAVNHCSGDLIFFADQDDVWHPDKVKTIVRWFDRHPDKTVVFSDATLIDENSQTLNDTLWQRFGFDWKKQKYLDHDCGLDIWFWSNRATGATIAIRKDFIDINRCRQYSNAFHDSIIAWQGIVTHSIGYINEKLMDYRIHRAQTCGADNTPSELFFTPLAPCNPNFFYQGFHKSDLNLIPEDEQKHVEFVLKRATFKNRWFGWGSVANIWTYVHFYRSWAYRFFFYDWYISVKHSLKRIIG